MDTQEHMDTQERFIGCMTEILRVGLAVCDAMKLSPRERRRTTRICLDGQDWMLEVMDAPQRMITITLLE